jgi:hypothetical protein
MTEGEWLTCTDPRWMVADLAGGVSERKLRLLAAACCRRVWDLLHDDRSRNAVEVVERFADGTATARELLAANEPALAAAEAVEREYRGGGGSAARVNAAVAVSQGTYVERDEWREVIRIHSVISAAQAAAKFAAFAVADRDKSAWAARHEAESAAQCALTRCVFGTPFRSAALDPALRDWNDRLVPRLAAEIYERRAFDRLPLLGDALEEAGCAERSILDHCRGEGPHGRGCWVVDQILGKT